MKIAYYDAPLSRRMSSAITRCRARHLRACNDKANKQVNADLLKALTKIKKDYNADIAPIRTLLERHDVDCVSTGHRAIDDIITGISTDDADSESYTLVAGSGRGLPRGRIIEVYGPESGGKTTLALEVIRSYQSVGLRAGFIDVEHALDFDYARAIGVDTDNLFYTQGADSAEDTLNAVCSLVKTNALDLLVIDSVAALEPEAEADGDVGDAHMGLHARLMSQALRKITALLTKDHRTTVIFINQTRQKIGIRFGNPETTTGGNALKFYASVRLRVVSTGPVKAGGVRGIRSKIKVVKNKVGMPHHECFIDITNGTGISKAHRADPRGKDKSSGEED